MASVDLTSHFRSHDRSAKAIIGRAHELQELSAALEAAANGEGRVVLVRGEAGVGKTRLAEALATDARARGLTVAWGSCWESGGAPVHWPWIQVLRTLTAGLRPDALAELFGRNARGVCAFAPELRDRLGDLAPPPLDPGASDGARFTAWDATASFLGEAAGDGLVVVIDDAHAADLPSLLFLRFLARHLHGRRLLVVATLRNEEEGERAEALDEIARGGSRLELVGLGEDAVGELAAAYAGRPVPPPFVRELRQVTGGNPFFALEALRLRLAGDEPDAFALPVTLPPTAGAVVARRLSPLDAAERELLAVAAVVGRQIDVPRVAELSGAPDADVEQAIEAGMRARLVEPHAGAHRFAHALVRDALYESLPPERRRELHGALAHTAAASGGSIGELAHHADAAGLPDAHQYSRAAGDAAIAGLAYEEAVAHYERALRQTPDDIELVLALADASMRSGDTAGARTRFAEAAQLARDTGDAELLAAAALGFGSGGETWANGGVDEELAELLEEALAVLPQEARRLRALVLARLADVLLYARDWERTRSLSAQAIAAGRESGDAVALMRAIEARLLALLCPAKLEERTVLAAELDALARATGDPEGVLAASTWLVTLALERGDRAQLDTQLARFAATADDLRQPHMMWGAKLKSAMLALLEARLGDAERLAHDALATGEAAVPLAQPMFGMQMLAIRGEQGQLAELQPGLRAMVEAFPEVHSWRISWAGMLLELGMEDEGRRQLEAIAERDFLLAQDDYEWISATAVLAVSFARLGDRTRCAVLYDRLLPYADQHAVVSIGLSYLGSVAHYLALLAEAIGAAGAAERHFEAAIAAHDRLGAVGYATRSRFEYGRMLTGRGRDGTALLRAAAETGERLGLAAGAAARALLDEHSTTNGRGEPSAVFVRDGDGWSIGDPLSPARLRDARGLGYIAVLLDRPGVPVAALDLAGGVMLSDAGPALDDAARRSYRRRLEELDAELDEAERWADPERVERLRGEMDALTSELGAATGLGGRDRLTGSSAERARVSVTKAIRTSLARISETDPATGDYLRRAIKTGATCSYEPPVSGALRWLLH